MTFDPTDDQTEGHISRRAHLDDADTEGHKVRRRLEEAGEETEEAAEGHIGRRAHLDEADDGTEGHISRRR